MNQDSPKLQEKPDPPGAPRDSSADLPPNLPELDPAASAEEDEETRLPEILDAAEKGSVIAKDKAVSLLCKLSVAGHAKKTLPVLLEMLKTSAVNQLPMYAEHVAAVITPEHRAALADVITRRLKTIDQASKRARLEKVLRKLTK